MPISTCRHAMHLVRSRPFARLLILALLAGLITPALATPFNTTIISAGVHSHVVAASRGHAEITASARSAHRVSAASVGHVQPGKASQHCPGCLSAADCALSCLGVGVLPMPPTLALSLLVVEAWTASVKQVPVGVRPIADFDPPRPVLIR